MGKKSKQVLISTSKQMNLFTGKQEVVVHTEVKVKSQPPTSAIANSPQSGDTASPSTPVSDTTDPEAIVGHTISGPEFVNALWLWRHG